MDEGGGEERERHALEDGEAEESVKVTQVGQQADIVALVE